MLERGDVATGACLKQQETPHKPPPGQRFDRLGSGCMGAVTVAIGAQPAPISPGN